MQAIESARLWLRAAEADDLPALLAVYRSHPDYVAMNEGSRGEQGDYDLEMLQRDWWLARMMPGRHMLALALKATGVVVGMADFAEEGPTDSHPWLGALVIAASHTRQGLGRESFARLADHLHTAHSATALRLGVRQENAPALAFFRAVGCRPIARPSSIPEQYVALEYTPERQPG